MYFILGGSLIGGIAGGVLNHFMSSSAPQPLSLAPQPDSSKKVAFSETPADLTAPELPPDIANNLEKITQLSSPQGRAICRAIAELCREIAVVANLIPYETEESSPEFKKIVHRSCSRLAEARLLLDKLYTVERQRAGMLEEFTIYKTTLQGELDGIGSSFNNYMTKHIMSV